MVNPSAYVSSNPGGRLLAFGGTRTWHRLRRPVPSRTRASRCATRSRGSTAPNCQSFDVSQAMDKRHTGDAEPVRVICRAIRAAIDVRDLRSRHLVEHFDGCHPRLIDRLGSARHRLAARTPDVGAVGKTTRPVRQNWPSMTPSVGACDRLARGNRTTLRGVVLSKHVAGGKGGSWQEVATVASIWGGGNPAHRH